MENAEIIANVKKYNWHFWIERPFGAFMISLFGPGKEVYEKINLPVEFEAFVFQDSGWYESKQVFGKMEVQMKEYFKKHSLFDFTKKAEVFYGEKKKRIKELAADKTGDELKQLHEIYEILTTATAFIWVTHPLEDYYTRTLQEEVPKYVKENVDGFIGDASFPEKKTATTILEDAIRNDEEPAKIVNECGWLRTRDGFCDPFNEEDIEKIKTTLKPSEEHKQVQIPTPLQKLFTEVKELVYFRTHRTDIFYELLYLSRPILQRVAKRYGLTFADLCNYSIQSLLNGKPQKYASEINAICYKGNLIISNDKILPLEKNLKINEVKGNIAQKGVVNGIVKIVKTVADLEKVQKGDVLVTQMTFPSFIAAMHRASAFVTDEGGITCHAAIVARELKKPCIIGTKNATTMLKDGDFVEVNADKGTVKKLN
ncbi:MAG: PEP-utilizing enzyme [Candidatus Micrarchaeota archaeon]